MEHGDEKPGALVVGGIASQEILEPGAGFGEMTEMPVRHGPAIDGAQVGTGRVVFPPYCPRMVSEVRIASYDLIVGVATSLPVSGAEFHIRQLDARWGAIGIPLQGEAQERLLF